MNGFITKLDNGRWRVRWRDYDGTNRSRTFDTKPDASGWLAFVRHKTSMQEMPLRSTMTVGDWVEVWLATKAATVRESTWVDYEAITRLHLPNSWRDRRVDAIGRPSAQKVVSGVAAHGSVGRARKVRAVLGSCFADALAEGLTDANPFARVAMPKSHLKGSVMCPSPDDVRLLAGAAPEWAAPMILIAGFGGLRWGEIVALRPEAVDLECCEIRVDRSYSTITRKLGEPKSKASNRRSVFSASIKADVGRALMRSTSGLLFPSPTGTFLDHSWFRRKVWLPTTDAAGLSGVRFHDLRHTYASALIAAGTSPPLVAAVMGHSSPAVTLDVYSNSWESQREGLADRLSLSI